MSYSQKSAVTVKDELPEGLTAVEAPEGASLSGQTVIWYVGVIASLTGLVILTFKKREDEEN